MKPSTDPRAEVLSGPARDLVGVRFVMGGVVLVTLSACGGRSDPLSLGQPGSTVEIADAGAECPYGGSKLIHGVDADSNGRLEGDEVQDTSLMCRSGPDDAPGSGGQPVSPGAGGMPGVIGSGGVPGVTGSGGVPGVIGSGGVPDIDDPAWVARTSREPMGPHCARGGVRFDVGLDDGHPAGTADNGLLEDEEVEPASTSYRCNDCIDLAVVGGTGSEVEQVAQAILGQAPSVFCGADLFNVETDSLAVEDLRKYEALLIFNSNLYPFTDPEGVGSDVAAFFDDGGQVVVSHFADAGYQITGDWTAKEYNRLTHEWAIIQTDSFTRADPAQGLVPDHPVLSGVEFLTGSGWIGPNLVMPGATAVAAYASGSLLAAAGAVTDAQGRLRNRVDLNIHPEDIIGGFWYGDGVRLLTNALEYH